MSSSWTAFVAKTPRWGNPLLDALSADGETEPDGSVDFVGIEAVETGRTSVPGTETPTATAQRPPVFPPTGIKVLAPVFRSVGIRPEGAAGPLCNITRQVMYSIRAGVTSPCV